MRSELLGYLLEALEPHEHKQVENELRVNDQLRNELDVLRRGMVCLEGDGGHYDAPAGLAHRTINTLFIDRAVATPGPASTADAVSLPTRPPREPPAASRRWRFADISTAAGILVAALAVTVPAIHQSRVNAQRIACQDKLQTTYSAIASYADRHQGVLPIADETGNFAAAGIVGPRLVSAGFLKDPQTLVCPDSDVDCNAASFPTLQQVSAASAEELAKMRKNHGRRICICARSYEGRPISEALTTRTRECANHFGPSRRRWSAGPASRLGGAKCASDRRSCNLPSQWQGARRTRHRHAFQRRRPPRRRPKRARRRPRPSFHRAEGRVI